MQAKGLPLIAEVIRLQTAGQADAAKALLMQSARPMFRVWLKEINQFIDLEEAKNKDIGSRARAMASGFLWLNLAVCGGALILVGCVAAWSALAIKPLSALTAVMRKLAAGDLSIVIPSLERKDEVGEMAGAVLIFKKNALDKISQEHDTVERTAAAQLVHKQAEADVSQKERRAVVDSVGEAMSTLSSGYLMLPYSARQR